MLYKDLIFINPNKLTFVLNWTNLDILTKKKLLSNNAKSIILDGEWDTNKNKDFECTDVYNSIKDHFENNIGWTETEFYIRVIGEINKGKTKWGCKTPEKFLKRLEEKVNNLYKDIKENGYKTQGELKSSKLSDEIRVAIDRNGNMLFVDGRHRLSIAKILNLNKIPVKIILIHKKWVDFNKI